MFTAANFLKTRQRTETIVSPLKIEDFSAQPIEDVSPPKWHLAHTTWFFERFVLKQFKENYQEFHPQFEFLFNSYYESIGQRVERPKRGAMTRPTVDEILQYRSYVTDAVADLLKSNSKKQLEELVLLGINHEQQHQELLLTDIKFILFQNPIYPAYRDEDLFFENQNEDINQEWIKVKEGLYEIGFKGEKDFCFDNEKGQHKVWLDEFSISNKLVTNAEYLEFVESGGYQNFKYWLQEGWSWVTEKNIKHPLYWVKQDNKWFQFTLSGLKPIDLNAPVNHVSHYEADAFADFMGLRLPTEFEWETASKHFNWGNRWEHTRSAYLAYPNFNKAPGAIGEYNGKFMINQMVLRGASIATPENHSRNTYRNFFHPYLQWQFSGIRLVK